MRQTAEMLGLVGFPDPERALRMYPFELSGGLRQRAMIAMALICRPSLLIADEPTTALDVTIQAQILALLKDLQQRLGMAVLIITHDLGVVANLADEVIVMYRGQVMEAGTVHSIFDAPSHPYLRALLNAVPHFDMKPGERLVPVREIDHQTGPLLKADEQRGTVAEVQLDVDNVSKTFTTRKTGWIRGQTHYDPRRVGREPRDPAWRMLRVGRRERLRQDHAVEDDHARADSRFRSHRVRRSRYQDRRRDRERGRAPALSPPRPVHLPGSHRIAVPADDRVRYPSRAADHSRDRRLATTKCRWSRS